MTEIAVPTVPMSDLMQWAVDAGEAHKIAQSLVKTSFVPDSMRNKADEATAAILTGQEIGLSPMAALRSIDIISGTPAMRSHALRGLVQSRGHEVWVEDSTNTRAIVCGRRHGSEQIQKSIWTMDRAKGLKIDQKDNWRKQPQAMLIARATAEVCRLIASDVILGIPYAVEELGDDDGQGDTAVSRPRRTAKRQPVDEAPLPEPEVPALEQPLPGPADEPAVVIEDGQEWPEPPPSWEPSA
jgi:hypothetical protein